MAHEIETHGTQAAAVFARKDAWHRLGTTVRDPLSRDSRPAYRRASDSRSVGRREGVELFSKPVPVTDRVDGICAGTLNEDPYPVGDCGHFLRDWDRPGLCLENADRHGRGVRQVTHPGIGTDAGDWGPIAGPTFEPLVEVTQCRFDLTNQSDCLCVPEHLRVHRCLGTVAQVIDCGHCLRFGLPRCCFGGPRCCGLCATGRACRHREGDQGD